LRRATDALYGEGKQDIVLTLPKMLSDANMFEIDEFQEDELRLWPNQAILMQRIIKGRPFGVGFECWLIPYKKGTPS